jgi:hypothetical protein
VLGGQWEAGVVRFLGLEPETDYVLEWRRGWRRPLERAVRTMPLLEDRIEARVAPADGGRIEVAVTWTDPKLSGIDLEVMLGKTPLERRAPGRFTGALPPAAEVRPLRAVLAGTGETLDLGPPVPGVEALHVELGELAGELERSLRSCPRPALVPRTALDPWVVRPLPVRRARGGGVAGLLDRLRRLAPVVSSVLRDIASPAGVRWKIVERTSRLVPAETLARQNRQPPLGVLAWMEPLLRVEGHAECPRNDRRFRALLTHTVQLTHDSIAGSPLGAMVEVIGGVRGTRVTSSLSYETHEPRGTDWTGLRLCGQAIDTSSPPVITFPHAGVAIEVPLIVWDRDADPASSLSTKDALYPGVVVDLWFRRGGPRGLWSILSLQGTSRAASRRVSPVYVYGFGRLEGTPGSDHGAKQ